MGQNVIEDIVEAPAKALDRSINTSVEVKNKILNQKPVQQAKHYWEILGPGLITGASDDDPSGIVTYSQTGAKYGFGLLWLAPLTFPLMAVVQEMCARIGLVTGRGLAANIRQFFPRYVIYICSVLLLVANSFNIGADLGLMAKTAQIIFPQAQFVYLVIGFTALTLSLQIFVPYGKYARYLKWLALILLSYVFSALLMRDVNWGQILKATIFPHFEFSKEQILLITGILGTTISPYLFFWQTSQEVEELTEKKVAMTNVKTPVFKRLVSDMRTDVWSGMFLSNLVMFFIIVACAVALNQSGITNVESAQDAALALRPLAGPLSPLLFAAGIVGVGLLGIPVLSGSAAYAISESLKWREGLHNKLNHAYSFYGLMIISMSLGLLMNFVGLDPIKSLIYAAVLNGCVAPVVLVFIILISSNKKVMGDFTNGKFLQIFGWATVALMSLATVATLYSVIFP